LRNWVSPWGEDLSATERKSHSEDDNAPWISLTPEHFATFSFSKYAFEEKTVSHSLRNPDFVRYLSAMIGLQLPYLPTER
jgi:hypothetical protein